MLATRSTHEVLNQPPPLEDYNVFDADRALGEALAREGGGFAFERCRDLGATVGSAEAHEHVRQAQRNIPALHTHDRYGNRVDRVEYDPGFQWILRLGVQTGVTAIPWRDAEPGAHVGRAALFYMLNGLDTGPCCPMSINYAAVPTMRQTPELAAEWEERIALPDYDRYAQAGMVMTEKQGGSDLRANTTRAEPAGDGWFEITGHKWFCSHPVFHFFFTLAHTEAGPTCFVAERPHPGFRLQRLKDKLGGRSLASAELEMERLPARVVGEEGRGIRAMSVQINYTRLDTALGMAGMMRRSVAEAIHHARHRMAFGKLLADQPLMRNVLADLGLESEAAMTSVMRVTRAYDSDDELPFRRLATAVIKYWICKRGPNVAVEALECLGGNGYVEEADLARVYRDIEIGTVWEGSGNVAALDVVRVMMREPESLVAFLDECELARGADPRLDAHIAGLRRTLEAGPDEWSTRRLVEDMAAALQASLLVRHSTPAVADAFCASRLAERRATVFGTLPSGAAAEEIIERSLAA